MPTQWQTFPFELTGGLITSMGRLEQGINFPGSASKLENFEEDVLGGYSRVLGHTKFSETAVPGVGQIIAAIPVSHSKVIAFRDGEWFGSEGFGWSSLLQGLGSSVVRVHYDMVNFTGETKFIIADGIHKPLIYNATTGVMAEDAAATSDVEGARFVRNFKNHVFFSKGTNLVFTSPYDETDYDPGNGAGIINIGDEITGLIVFREQLIVFCLNKIMRIVGDSEADFVLQPITMNTGCLCGFTVQEVGGDVMYLGPDGIRYLSATEREGDFGLTRASANIQDIVTSILSNNCLYSSVTLAKKNQYRFFYNLPSVPRDKTKNLIGVKFSDQSAVDISWSQFVGVKVYSLNKLQERDREFIVFSDESNHIQVLESGNTFDGRVIEAVLETPFLPLNDPKLRKTFYKHTVYTALQGTTNLIGQLIFDYSVKEVLQPDPFYIVSGASAVAYNSGIKYDQSAKYSTGGNRVEFYNNVQGSGFVVSLKYQTSGQGASFNLNFVVLEYRTNERK